MFQEMCYCIALFFLRSAFVAVFHANSLTPRARGIITGAFETSSPR